MSSRAKCGVGLLSLLIAMSQPGVFAQAAGPGPGPVAPSFAPPITPTIQPQGQPRALPVSPVSLPNIPTTTSIILPTDTVHWSVDVTNLARGGSKGGESTPNVFTFTDLPAFLKEHGWEHGSSSCSDRAALLSEEGITVDTAFAEDDYKLVPLSSTGHEAHLDWLSSNADNDHVIVRFNEACPELSVFTQSDQFMHIGKGTCDDALVTGHPGTTIATSKDDIVLYNGQLLVDAGKSAARIATRAAGVKIEAESTAMVTYQPTRALSVRALAGSKAAPTRVRLAVMPGKVFELQPGQVLKVDLSQPGDEAAKTISISQSEPSDCPAALPEKAGGECSHEFQRMRAHLSSLTVGQSHDRAHCHAHTMLLQKPLHLLGTAGTRFVASPAGDLALLSGKLFVHSSTPQVITSQLGDIYLQGNSATSLERWQGELRAQCCGNPKSAILVANNCGVPMNWGMETLITDHNPGLSDVAPDDRIGRRNFELHNLDGKYCVVSDFSIPALLLKADHLKSVRKPETPVNQHLRNHLLKTAAALQLVTAKKGRYYLQVEIAAATSQRTR